VKIAHLTSVHRRDDTRILLKECRSAAQAGHDVVLVVADGRGPDVLHGIAVVDAGRSGGRSARVLSATRRVWRKAIEVDADLYHLHDPELLPVGLGLKRRGKRVVFDSHEDVPRQLLAKHYLPSILRRPVAGVFSAFERCVLPRFDALVAATPAIAARLDRLHPRTVVVANFPRIEELHGGDARWQERQRLACYIGGITRIRGAEQLLDAISRCRSDASLAMAGTFEPESLASECAARTGWARTEFLGHLDRDGVRSLLRRSTVGLVTFHPAPNHVESQPNKLFEYMSAGLPVIASDFPLWRRIVEGCGCGLLVDPLDPAAIAAAIDRLLGDPEEARRMGERGRAAVERLYNWQAEEARLLALYESL
jgi:glycosyltransferase involved in cell wall biosynthesis